MNYLKISRIQNLSDFVAHKMSLPGVNVGLHKTLLPAILFAPTIWLAQVASFANLRNERRYGLLIFSEELCDTLNDAEVLFAVSYFFAKFAKKTRDNFMRPIAALAAVSSILLLVAGTRENHLSALGVFIAVILALVAPMQVASELRRERSADISALTTAIQIAGYEAGFHFFKKYASKNDWWGNRRSAVHLTGLLRKIPSQLS